jgi:HPt (histidine-containing phosphotransfer) domain-containing protein
LSGSEPNIFDATFALNQFSGNQSLLVQILEKFITQYQNFDSSIAEHLEQSDIQAVKQKVHTLKGVSGNLGMKALHLACKEFEKNIEKQVVENSSENFLLIFKNTLAFAQNYAAEKGMEEPPKTIAPQDNKTLLIAALRRNEFISESKMQSYSQSLGLSSEKLNELNNAIDNLDYTIAIKLLE